MQERNWLGSNEMTKRPLLEPNRAKVQMQRTERQNLQFLTSKKKLTVSTLGRNKKIQAFFKTKRTRQKLCNLKYEDGG